MSNRVELTIKKQVAYVSLSRADKHNAIDMAMFYQIIAMIKKLKKNKAIRAVILTGDGQDFCTGLDVKSVLKSPFNGVKLLFKWLPWHSNIAQRVSTGWRELNVPVIAVIQGRCWGGGLQIALGADFRFANPNLSMSIMEGKWGLVPDMGGSIPFREQMKVDQTKLLAMTAEEIDADKAYELGMITKISDSPLEDAEELVERLLKQSPDAIAAVKKLYNNSWWKSAGNALAKESWYQVKVMLGKNQKIKTYNQTHDINDEKPFKERKNW